MSAKLTGMNEFREQMADERQALMPRAECDIRLRALDDKIRELTEQVQDVTSQKAGAHVGWQAAVAIVILIGAIVAIFTAMK